MSQLPRSRSLPAGCRLRTACTLVTAEVDKRSAKAVLAADPAAAAAGVVGHHAAVVVALLS
jgi:hypothetical protein